MQVQNQLTPKVHRYRYSQQLAGRNKYNMPKIKKANLMTSLKNMQIIHDENGVNKLMPRVRLGYNSFKNLFANNKNLLVATTALATTATIATSIKKNENNTTSTKLGTAHAQPTGAPKTWKKYAEEHGLKYKAPEKSGVVINDKNIEEQRQKHEARQKDLDYAFRYPEGKHPSVTKLGTAHAQPTGEAKTWRKNAEQFGGPYKGAKVSGVVVNDVLAEVLNKPSRSSISTTPQVIEESKPSVTPITTKPVEQKNPTVDTKEKTSIFSSIIDSVKNFARKHIIPIAIGFVALLSVLFGAKTCNTQEQKSQFKLPNEIVAKRPEPKDTMIIENIQDKTNKDIKPVQPNTENKSTKTRTIKKGDNVWNIAKQNLKEINGKKPSNKEVLAETKRLIDLNNYHFEKDGKTVLIYPKNTIKLY